MNRLGPWRICALSSGTGLALFAAGVWMIPWRWCARESRAWYDGDAILQQQLARGVEQWVNRDLTRSDFTTGHSKFNGEWLFGTYLMAALGFGQTALEHPEWRDHHLALMNRCIERLLSAPVRKFDRESWGDDPLESLAGDSDHAAYLGYLNLALSYHRLLDTTSSHAALNDKITAALVRRIEHSKTLLLHTYPNEMYPVDNCAVIASIGLYDRATGADHQALLRRWSQRCRERYIDPRSGLLYQAVDFSTGDPTDHPRGSGTSLGLYFLSFADPSLSQQLFRAVETHLARSIFGFGVVREYPDSVREGDGDIDSGPVIFGYGISPTGFGIAGSRIHRNAALYSRLTSTAYLFGAPLDRTESREYVTGGPLGNAIMFAMLTAQPATVSGTGKSQ